MNSGDSLTDSFDMDDQMQPTDLEQMVSMLDRAKIVYKKEVVGETEVLYIFSETKSNPYYSVWHFGKTHGRLLRVINE